MKAEITKLREYAEENVCPRCGSDGKELNWTRTDDGAGWKTYSVTCMSCGLEYQEEFVLLFTGIRVDETEEELQPKPDLVREVAPNLLEACETMLKAWEEPTSKSVGMRGEAILNIRNAVAKAKP